MPDRDWEKELAEIDRRINTNPAPAPTGPAGAPAAPVAVPSAPRGTRAAPARVTAGAGPTVVTTPRRTWKSVAGLAFRLLIAAALLACVVVWPYETRCGVGLGAYLAAIGVTALASLWTSIAAWRHRTASLHVLGLAMLLASGVFGAREVLPRVGYAIADPDHPTIWACQ
jgi:hypothetical protein